jgi:hypothetical protein
VLLAVFVVWAWRVAGRDWGVQRSADHHDALRRARRRPPPPEAGGDG